MPRFFAPLVLLAVVPADLPAAGGPEDSALAADRQFWAFQPPQRPSIPLVRDVSWPRRDIDRFVLAKLEEKELAPARDADPYTLLRRVTFDLTGLPPTPDEIEAFTSDHSPDAFEKVVDRLLAWSAFGERWGRHWLDLAQYADTVSIDRLFPDNNAWRYRDYVIRSFNDDTPFDQFIREQIAGDLLPAANDRQRAEQMIATAFLTHGPIQTINQFKEQLRWDIVDNQVHKVGVVFMGLTMQCARCHDHKFDPITQRDYFALAGIFQNLQVLNGFYGQSKVFSDWVRVPLPESPEERIARGLALVAHANTSLALQEQIRQAEVRTRELEQRLNSLKENSASPMPCRSSKLPACEPTSKDACRHDVNADVAAVQTELDKTQKQLGELRNRLTDHDRANVPEPPYIFGAKEVPSPTNGRITIRGNAYQLGDEVSRGFIRVVSVGKSPEITNDSSGRLQLAQWLTDSKHPLTARVAVNRIWQHVFGAGLVRTVDNFGLRGEEPTHPALLDHLAIRFVESGWSVKQLIRELVTSRTYRMSSEHNAAALAVDPDNRLLWRMHRRRLEAEAIRDAVLVASGQLDCGRGGPSLPPAGWLGGAVSEYIMIKGEPPPPPHIANRRTVYLPVYRRPPEWADGLVLFNCAVPSVVTGARPVTIVPTQSLYLMNSPFLIDHGRKAAGRLLERAGLSDAARVEAFFLEALNRPATMPEVERALRFIGRLTENSTPRPEAWGIFCHSVFASNEFLFRF